MVLKTLGRSRKQKWFLYCNNYKEPSEFCRSVNFLIHDCFKDSRELLDNASNLFLDIDKEVFKVFIFAHSGLH